ncbi:unnamed protein product [Adineta ricciae]|nr:unnamed protein product [Adineta ricciae]
MHVQVPNSDDYMVLYYFGGEKRMKGVGYAVDRTISQNLIAFQPISSRLAILSLYGTINTHIIAAYAPTEVNSDQSKNEFYIKLRELLDALPRKDLILIAGDLNAQVGSNRQGWEDVHGNYGIGNMNDNGLRLLSFAAANELTIENSLFRHPLKHQLTWRAPNGKDMSVLDYFLVRRRFRTSLMYVRTMRGADCASDHHLVRTIIQIRLKRPCPKSTTSKRRDWSKLADPTVQQCFQMVLTNQFAALKETDDINEATEQFSKAMKECTDTICTTI